jgi:hypothetical protein
MASDENWYERNKEVSRGIFFQRNRVPMSPEVETVFGHTKLLQNLFNLGKQFDAMLTGDYVTK